MLLVIGCVEAEKYREYRTGATEHKGFLVLIDRRKTDRNLQERLYVMLTGSLPKRSVDENSECRFSSV